MTWPRTAETLLACWLLAGLWILPSEGSPVLSIAVAACAVLTLIFALSASVHPFGRRHLTIAGVGILLAVLGYLWAAETASPMAQNAILCGALLTVLGLLPTRTSAPPRGWEQSDA